MPIKFLEIFLEKFLNKSVCNIAGWFSEEIPGVARGRTFEEIPGEILEAIK